MPQTLPATILRKEERKMTIDTEKLRNKKLLTRDEAAAYLGIGITSLQTLIHGKGFPALVRIGTGRGRVFVNREKLDAWIDARTGK